jgi:hypothetical protein
MLSPLLFLPAVFVQAGDAASTDKYLIGTYYYPGWQTNESVSPARRPWERIEAFPEREPLLGWYNEGNESVMNQHLQWMHDYAIDFVVFDWYWTGKRPRNEHAIKTYLEAKNKKLVRFSLLWANHEASPRNEDEFTSMVRYWVRGYFREPLFFRIDSRPVVYIFDPIGLDEKARKFGSSTRDLLAKADGIARESGYPGIFFVAGTHAATPFVDRLAQAYGYRALSGYNYSVGRTIHFDSFQSLDRGYQEHWDWIVQNSPLPYFLALSSGWDKRPWGGSPDPRRDLSVSTPDLFEKHLRAAKELMVRYPDKTLRTAVICCWNEFGEGSYIEPTKAFQFQYLERIKKVFGGNE